MKIVILSDTHDNLANFKKVVGFAKKEKISHILHCGDISNPKTLKEALRGYSGRFFGVLGNADNIYQFDLKDYQISSKVKVFKDVGKIELAKKKIAFIHYPWEARKLVSKYDIVFYGHTHMPWQKKVGNCFLVNPGNAAGIVFKPTFAVYDTEDNELELKII